MATEEHTETQHRERLNSLCRLCGRKAEKVKNRSVMFCKRFAPEIAHFWGVVISEETDGKLYSNRICMKCYSRLHKMKTAEPSQRVRSTLIQMVENSKDIWTHFDPSVDATECSVCLSVLQPSRVPRRKRKKCKPPKIFSYTCKWVKRKKRKKSKKRIPFICSCDTVWDGSDVGRSKVCHGSTAVTDNLSSAFISVKKDIHESRDENCHHVTVREEMIDDRVSLKEESCVKVEREGCDSSVTIKAECSQGFHIVKGKVPDGRINPEVQTCNCLVTDARKACDGSVCGTGEKYGSGVNWTGENCDCDISNAVRASGIGACGALWKYGCSMVTWTGDSYNSNIIDVGKLCDSNISNAAEKHGSSMNWTGENCNSGFDDAVKACNSSISSTVEKYGSSIMTGENCNSGFSDASKVCDSSISEKSGSGVMWTGEESDHSVTNAENQSDDDLNGTNKLQYIRIIFGTDGGEQDTLDSIRCSVENHGGSSNSTADEIWGRIINKKDDQRFPPQRPPYFVMEMQPSSKETESRIRWDSCIQRGNDHSSQTDSAKLVRPLEELHFPLTKAEEAYLTGIVHMKMTQSRDKATVLCRSQGQPLILKKIIRPRTTPSCASKATLRHWATRLASAGRECCGNSEADVVKHQGQELKLTRKGKRSEIVKAAGCGQEQIIANQAAKLRANRLVRWAKERQFYTENLTKGSKLHEGTSVLLQND